MADESWQARQQALAAQLEGRSDEEILKGVEAEGVGTVLDQAFRGMAEAFMPEKAAGQSAVVQYDVNAAGTVHSFQLKIAGGKCEVARGVTGPARVTLALQLPDFLRIVAGKLAPVQAFMTGKLKIQGDVMLATAMQTWFPPPGAPPR